ncbi:glycoside hydrolase family 27 protein (plasmid) [Deinococcus radiomollis]|uniref:glycoside hydrolase family 27 protein n=1 Tax=Deinococcus radiomollis TaxID=468916 RepID=UPI003891ACD5
MGWNSWDCYGASVTEAEVRGNAGYMAEHLLAYGWEYVVVDIQWYEPGANSSLYRPFVPLEMDGYSRLIPATNRFPSAANGVGFRALAHAVHAQGLKFGIHIMRGIPRQAVHADTPLLGTSVTARDIAHPNSICPWNTDMYGVDASKEGAQAYYDSLFALYAQWGVDLVKVDDISASRLYHFHAAEILLIRRALDGCGRPMVLSLSPGPAPLEHGEFLQANANMWRLTDDFWDQWPGLAEMFGRCHEWTPFRSPGHWPDPDMLPLGHLGLRSVDGGAGDRMTRFTHDEQRTLMTLWCMSRAPLMFGGELRDNDPWTLSLLTNRRLLEIQRSSSGNRQLWRRGGSGHSGEGVAWTAQGEQGQTYLALFNLGETEDTFHVPYRELGLTAPVRAEELWSGDVVPPGPDTLSTTVTPHGVRLFELM